MPPSVWSRPEAPLPADRSLASAVSMLLYNMLGYFAGPAHPRRRPRPSHHAARGTLDGMTPSPSATPFAA